MSAKIEKVENNVAHLEIEVEASKFQEAVKKSYIKNVGQFAIPGFRKGKAPRKIIETYYGEGVFYEDAVNIIIPEAYDEAVEETKIEPVEQPSIDIKQIGSGENFIFTAEVTVKPEVKVGDYNGIEINKIEYNVTDEDVDGEIKKLQEQNARLITVEDRATQKGDTVIMDFEGFTDGEPFEGGKATNYNLELGSGQFIPGFEEQLIGKNIAEETEVNVTFPEDYNAEELAGKEAMFKVVINEIKFKELPEIDDEFAKDVSEFDTLDELKKDTREKLEKQAADRTKSEIENTVIEKIAEKAVVDIPKVMIDNQVESRLSELDNQFRMQGMDLDGYVKMTGGDIDKLREQFREGAEEQVKSNLVLEKICELEKVEATEDEIKEEIKKMAEMYKMEADKVEEMMGDHIDSFKKELAIRKTVDIVVKNAKIV
jgi:trigger factor